ncbi:MAG: SRPBCC family protein [Geminicoccaceae bacterium]
MDMSGEYRIAAPRDKVWAGLNDPETLRASIPGCESLEKTGDNAFAAKVKAKVGPVKATFNGDVTLSDIKPPESYTISGEGKGGAAGFAKGGADVKLADDGDGGTILTYTAKADVGGKLAQLGSRLIDGTSKKMADEFFSNFREQVAPAEPAAAEAAASALSEVADEVVDEVDEGLAGLVQNRFVQAGLVLIVLMILVSLFR